MESGQKEESLSSEVEITKSCSDCKTTKTPLWRSGPSGPKSLCNACGIRYRKKRPTTAAASTPDGKNDGKKGKIGKTRSLKIRDALKVNLRPLGKEVEVMEGQRSPAKRLRSPRQWGEVERAALLLMALSCGAVFA
ncbi:hypothetical protein CDL12_23226 [Handroanthus impetiginosus]|uniref:GATA-type domain-containing protein n=1 Tax=Handroanthus impetiginosus TaxID=429701 RepID=A0A2G9GGU6_9LAMI|nr:hypothetical protein CDL12_23226 [Handroanthus impetiginosus]